MLFALLGAVGGAAGHAHLGHTATGHAHAGIAHGGHMPGGHVHPAHAGARTPMTVHQPALHAGAGHGGSTWMGSVLGWMISWLNPLGLAAAALWFGAAGLLAESAGPSAIVVAIVAALVGAAVVRAALSAFVRAGTPPLSQTADGAIATVNASIRPDAAGEVIFTLEGLRRSAPARSLSGRPIPRGESVVIIRRENGMALVEPLDPLDQLLDDGGTKVAQSKGEAQ